MTPDSEKKDGGAPVNPVDVLRDVEWAGPKSKGYRTCPWCRGLNIGGHGAHMPSCKLAAALSSTRRDGGQS